MSFRDCSPCTSLPSGCSAIVRLIIRDLVEKSDYVRSDRAQACRAPLSRELVNEPKRYSSVILTASISYLYTGLTNVDGDDFTHYRNLVGG